MTRPRHVAGAAVEYFTITLKNAVDYGPPLSILLAAIVIVGTAHMMISCFCCNIDMNIIDP